MENIYIVGVGMTHFDRHMDKSVKQLTALAVEDALKDAGCDRKAIEAAFFGNTGQGHFDGQHMIRGQVALLPLGIQGIPIYNVEAACASASSAFNLAVMQLRAGAADVALAVGASVAAAGVIGFVGIVVPHLIRLSIGPDHRLLLPLSAVGGAALLVGADIIARLVVVPAELPIGIVTAFIGAPFFLWLLLRRGRIAEL